MVLYLFGLNFWKEQIDVREIEVKERENSYIGNSTRVLKSEINTLSRYGSMYCLDNNPSTFINAIYKATERDWKNKIEEAERCKDKLKIIEKLKEECK